MERSSYPNAVQRVIDAFNGLPGVGRRSAERLAFHLLKAPAEEAEALANAVLDLKRLVRHCRVCFNLADDELCPICGDPRRDRESIMVVEQPKDLLAIEQAGAYRGLYHVLMGRLSPLDGVGPEDLTIDRVLTRIDTPDDPNVGNAGGVSPQEIILGLNPTLEGDGTGLYLGEQLRTRDVRVSRLARGLPTGGQIEMVNRAVLAEAIAARQTMGTATPDSASR